MSLRPAVSVVPKGLDARLPAAVVLRLSAAAGMGGAGGMARFDLALSALFHGKVLAVPVEAAPRWLGRAAVVAARLWVGEVVVEAALLGFAAVVGGACALAVEVTKAAKTADVVNTLIDFMVSRQ